ncbi:MAG: ATP-dependent helicase [Candidatus Dormibacteraeota bacterium]|nr:ATP-dependent helicase [Candidatus Dormibacteraeota bacterium]
MLRLSAEQVEASQQLEGPVRLVAGAGTGKTAVIAERFRRLVESGVSPASILVMTFTERAAGEMRQRITDEIGGLEPPQVGTFHSLALRWLREEAIRAGLHPGFDILSGPDRWISLRELMWELGDPALIGVERPDDLVGPLLKLQERLKQELVPLSRLAAWAGRVEDEERRAQLRAAARLFGAYAARCRQDRLLDFDDLLVHVVRLFESHPELRGSYAERFPWLMVDEYQDTNLAQERIVELLGGPDGNVCVVGDDDQSIYRFRGASRASMERFLACFPGAETRALGRNRRSVHSVVSASRRLIEQNPDRLSKPLHADPDLAPGVPVEVWRFERREEEAAAIARAAVEIVASGVRPGEIAVLVRTHALARPVGEALAAAGMPFRHWAAQGLFQRPEIRDLVAYLRLLRDPSDLLALARLLVRPPLYADLAVVLRSWREGASETASGEAGSGGALAPLQALKDSPATAAWAATVEELAAAAARLGVDDLLFELLERTRHLDQLVAACGADRQEGRRVAANVGRFAELVADYCGRRRDHSLSGFVDYLELVLLSGVGVEEAELEEAQDAIQVMTIHQAKGLEFDSVFVPALVEGRLPQASRKEGLEVPAQLLEPAVRAREDHVAEERRLCYVAMTRARRRLVLSYAERYEGARRWRPSRFLEELSGGPEVVTAEPGDSRAGSPPAPGQPAEASEIGIPADQQLPPVEQSPQDQMEKPSLSFSAISSYRECPRQHWYRYRLRLPAVPSLEAQFGTVVHLTLMQAGRLRQQGREVGIEVLQDLYAEAWEGMGLAEPRRRPALEALGWRLLKRFLAEGGLAGRPRLVEAPFTADLDIWTLRGIIDRVDGLPPPTQEGGGRVLEGSTFLEGTGGLIVDYKTGRPVPASRLRRDLQVALYALGARATLGLDPLELEIVYLREGKRVRLLATEDLLGEARRIGDEVAEGIRAGRFEARPERRKCSLCAYRLACEEAL